MYIYISSSSKTLEKKTSFEITNLKRRIPNMIRDFTFFLNNNMYLLYFMYIYNINIQI